MSEPATHDSSRREFLGTVAVGSVAASVAASLPLGPRASADVKHLAEAQVAALEARIAEMQAMQATLRHLVHACAGNERPDCPILADFEGKG